MTLQDKAELMENIKNETTDEVRELLAKCNPDTALPYDEIRPITASHSQMKSTISKELVKKFEYLKSLISHENVNPTHEEQLTMAVDALIEKVEKKKGLEKQKVEVASQGIERKNSKTEIAKFKITKSKDDKSEDNKSKDNKAAVREMRNEGVTAVSEVPRSVKFPTTQSTRRLTDGNSRYVPKNVKRMVFQRAQGQCEHTYASGKRCSSQFQTQFDHVIAFSKGGETKLENMQLLCRVHNDAKGSS